jgi:hypothetical protein
LARTLILLRNGIVITVASTLVLALSWGVIGVIVVWRGGSFRLGSGPG